MSLQKYRCGNLFWLALLIFASQHSNPSRDTAARFLLNLTQIWAFKNPNLNQIYEI